MYVYLYVCVYAMCVYVHTYINIFLVICNCSDYLEEESWGATHLNQYVSYWHWDKSDTSTVRFR